MREIGREAFCGCAWLKTVTFAENSRLERVGSRAFSETGISAFVSPGSLRKLGHLAFYDCDRLKTVRLNEGIRELGPMCFLGTRVRSLQLPSGLEITQKELGINCGRVQVVSALTSKITAR